jgi:hypothetical protein
VIAWHDDGTADVRALARGRWHDAPLDDRSLSGAIQGVGEWWGPRGYPIKVVIDAPFGWPAPFVDALTAHDRLDPWPSEINGERKRFERRATDFFVHTQGCKLPLSVSTDRIASCAMRCAVILGDARAVQQKGGTLWPAPGEQTDLARTEGWIHLPTDARLGQLLQG